MGTAADDVIRLEGARVHNLRDVSVEIPRGRLVALTGVSGSGKSSLAFDTLHAEGQRRFLETLSSFVRQLIEQLEPPDVDLIEGLPPTSAIDQKSGPPNPRATVGTITEILDYLRVLFARVGDPHCPSCGLPIQHQTPEQMVAVALAQPAGSKLLVLAPLVRRRKGEHLDAIAKIRRAGLIRARIDGEIIDVLDQPPKLARTRQHSIDAVVDRLVLREGIRPRLAESVDRAVQLGGGTVVFSLASDDGKWRDRVLSARLACPDCGIALEELEPRLLSFNSPQGACPDCSGLGHVLQFDDDLVVPDPSKSLASGAVAAWSALPIARLGAVQQDPALLAFLKRHRIAIDQPVERWSARARQALLHGTPENGSSTFLGILSKLSEEMASAPPRRRDALAAYQSPVPCASCGGTRLRPEARAITIQGKSLPHLLALTCDHALAYAKSLKFPEDREPIAAPLLQEIVGRLSYLERAGLGYLSLDRPADSLSGGELQRVRLASQIGSGLVGVCYILDEPTTGLHPRDTERLLGCLRSLRDLGNTVIVVEHDETVIRSADWVIDLGPGAGPDGGRIVAQGTPDTLQGAESPTARWLRGELMQESRPSHRLANSPSAITITGASEHNLKSIDVRIPIGTLVCVTGVSGSGKSTLVQDVLSRAARRTLEGTGSRPGAFRKIAGLDAIDKLIAVDQSPIGRTPRSTPATYTGVFDEIRRVFALTRDAKTRGYKSSRFSFNARGGRCETCLGQGLRRVEMQFLPDLYVRCEACDSRRFNRATLEIRYKGRSIADVLEMRVDEALPFFDAVPRIHHGLEALHEAGLGYVTLGQPSTTLSGGEAQRVKLAAELGRASTGRTLFILDEPTTGLHHVDVLNLRRVMERLADTGNTLVVIEHNLDLIRAADWLIDLGPEAGDAGGRVVAMGTPGHVAKSKESHTGRYLKSL